MADKFTERDVAIVKELESVVESLKEASATLAENFKKTAASASKLSSEEQKRYDISQKNTDTLQTEAALYESIGQKASDMQIRADYMYDAAERRLELHQRLLAADRERLELRLKNGEIMEEMYEQKLLTLKASEDVQLQEQKRLTQLKGAKSVNKDIADGIMKMAGLSDELSLEGKLLAAFANGASLKDILGGVYGNLKKAEFGTFALDAASKKLTGGIIALATAAFHQALALDSAQSDLDKLTGGMGRYNQVVEDAYQNNKAYGVTVENASSATANLFRNTSQFSLMNQKTQGELIDTGALLEQAGVSADAFSMGLEVSMKALGNTAEQARDTQTDLLRFAQELGMSPQMMAESFADAGPVLAKFSYNAERNFKDVAKAAKATGMEISRILDYTQQFDTFEGAADKVGSLNAMLGGDFVNAMDLMAAENPAERMRMITDAVNEAGKSFEDMSYYEKMAIAEAGGFADVQELSKALSGDLDTLNVSTEQQALEQERLAEIARTNQDVQSQLAAAFAAMAPDLKFIIDKVSNGLNKVLPILARHGGKIIVMLGALKVVAMAAQFAMALKTLGLISNTAALGANRLAGLKNIAMFVAEKVAIGLSTAGYILYAGALGTVTLAKFALAGAAKLLGMVMAANPIGLAIVGILAVGAAIYALVNGWEKTVDMMKTIGIRLFQVITFPMRAAVASVIGGFNLIIRGMNKIPGVNIPIIPNLSGAMAAGIPMLSNGANGLPQDMMTITGDGPGGKGEVTTLPQGASVAPANTNSPAVEMTRVITAAHQMGRTEKGMGGGQPVQITSVLQLDKRVLATATEETVIGLLDPAQG
tara:strand:+ start:8937 stop:11411 length:2475 start_codon:yes stop_codon:yes gene_type:complete